MNNLPRVHRIRFTMTSVDWLCGQGAVWVSSALALVLYLNTLPAEFVYDDSRAILKNPDLLPHTPITDLFFNDFWGTPLTHSGSHKSYRPLCVLTFRLNYALDGHNPLGYHLVNVILHAGVTALFVHTIRKLIYHNHRGHCSNLTYRNSTDGGGKREEIWRSSSVKFNALNMTNGHVNKNRSAPRCSSYGATNGINYMPCFENNSHQADMQIYRNGDALKSYVQHDCNGHSSATVRKRQYLNGDKCNSKSIQSCNRLYYNNYSTNCCCMSKNAFSNGAKNSAQPQNGRSDQEVNDWTTVTSCSSCTFRHVNRKQNTEATIVPLVSGLLFASHPIHTEAVAGVVGRADLLACIFFLLSFLSYIEYCYRRSCDSEEMVVEEVKQVPTRIRRRQIPEVQLRRWFPAVRCVIFAGAAMLSKEQGVTVLVVCAVYELFVHNYLQKNELIHLYRKQYRSLQEGLLLLGSAGVMLLAFRVYLMGSRPPYFSPADNPASDSPFLLTRTLTYAYLPALNFCLLLLPVSLSFDWSMGAVPLIDTVSDFRNIYTAVFYVSFALVIKHLIRHLNQKTPEKLQHRKSSRNHVQILHSNCSTTNNRQKSASSLRQNNPVLRRFSATKPCTDFLNSGHTLLTSVLSYFDVFRTRCLSCVPDFAPDFEQMHKTTPYLDKDKAPRLSYGKKPYLNGHILTVSDDAISLANGDSLLSQNITSSALDLLISSVGSGTQVTEAVSSSTVTAVASSTTSTTAAAAAVTSKLYPVSSVNHSVVTTAVATVTATTPSVTATGVTAAAAAAIHLYHLELLALSFLVFPFLPATNLFFYVGFVVAERILYIPSLGFCLLVAQGVDRFRGQGRRTWGSRALFSLMLVLLVLSYCVRTVCRNEDWLNEESLYRSGIAVNPAKALGNLANVLNAKGRTKEAELTYTAALSHRKNMADVHYNLGILYQEQGRYNEAIQSYNMAIQCRPKLTMAHLNLGIVYASIGRIAEAEQIYRKCASLDTTGLKDPRIHEQTKISALYNLGRLLADQDKHQDAIEVYTEALERRPDYYQPQSLYNMLGESYAKLDQFDKARISFNEALKAKPDHIPAHLTLAKLSHRQGNLQEAENWYLKARKTDPRDANIYQHYGQFLSEVGRYAEASECYKEAWRLLPNDFEVLLNAANSFRQAGRHAEAEVYYRKGVALRPTMALAHMNLGAMLHSNGKLAEAEESYLTALRLKPDDTVTSSNLAKLRQLIEKNNKAQIHR